MSGLFGDTSAGYHEGTACSTPFGRSARQRPRTVHLAGAGNMLPLSPSQRQRQHSNYNTNTHTCVHTHTRADIVLIVLANPIQASQFFFSSDSHTHIPTHSQTHALAYDAPGDRLLIQTDLRLIADDLSRCRRDDPQSRRNAPQTYIGREQRSLGC